MQRLEPSKARAKEASLQSCCLSEAASRASAIRFAAAAFALGDHWDRRVEARRDQGSPLGLSEEDPIAGTASSAPPALPTPLRSWSTYIKGVKRRQIGSFSLKIIFPLVLSGAWRGDWTSEKQPPIGLARLCRGHRRGLNLKPTTRWRPRASD